MKSLKIPAGQNKTIVAEIGRDCDRTYQVGKNAHLTLVLILFAGRGAKASATIGLDGEGATAEIFGFVVGKGSAKTQLHTLQFHNAPKTTSNLLIKGILNDTSSISYEGRIFVSKKAHLTDAYQKNENLLLSKHTHAVSKPTLEILANDVRCTHGSTTGTLSPESLWYLKSRGINETEARELMVEGFFEHAISQISDKIVQDRVRRSLWQILSEIIHP